MHVLIALPARPSCLLAPLAADTIGAGTVETGSGERGIVSSHGVRAYHRSTRAQLTVLASAPDSSGYAEDGSGRLGDLDAECAEDVRELGGLARP